MGPLGTGWHPLQRLLFYPHLTPTTKTVTLEPRRGNSFLKAYRPFFRERSCVNAMSLGNRGVHHLVENVIPLLPKPSIISIYATSTDECEKICAILTTELRYNPTVLAVEINLSCPNVGEIDQGKMILLLEIAGDLPWAVIAKIGHQESYIKMALEAAAAGLIDGISAINSVPWRLIFGPEAISPLEATCGQQGGVSGKLIKPIALNAIKELRRGLDQLGLPEFPLIAGGGISSLSDVEEFKSAGATYFSLGSALNMPNLWPEVCRTMR